MTAADIDRLTVDLRLNAASASDAPLLANVASVLRQAGRFPDAYRCLERAIALQPDSPLIQHNAGMLCEDVGEFPAARSHHERAWNLIDRRAFDWTGYPVDRRLEAVRDCSLACALSRLRDREFAPAWKLWEMGRLEHSWQPLPGIPLWQGESLRAKHLLVHWEGGYGDVICFSRWFPGLVAEAGRVTFFCMPSIANLLAYEHPRVHVVSPQDFAEDPHRPGQALRPPPEVPQVDFQTALQSLPAVRRVASIADIPPVAWTRAPRRTRKLARLVVGICWSAEEVATQRPHRSIPPAELEPLASLPVDWINLTLGQKDAPAWIRHHLANPRDPKPGWVTTSGMMRLCDAVVSSDTANAHLALSMGVPTWLVLPLRTDWKWFDAKAPLALYPEARVVRQDHPLEWRGAISRLKAELEAWSAA